MKITSLHAWEICFPLTEPYSIAYEQITESRNVFLQIETDEKLFGLGVTVPDLAITNENTASVLHSFSTVIEPILKGENPFQISYLLEKIQHEIPAQPAALALVDLALHDLLAKKAALPLYQLLGGYRSSIPTSITIGILSVEETLRRAEDFVQQGFFILKIKGGQSLAEDIERMSRLREQFGAAIRLRFDANQGYTVQETLQFVEATQHCQIEILEQPTAKAAFDALGKVTAQTNLSVMADESIVSVKDAFKIVKNGLADMINVKLMKVGGIQRSLHINSLAKAATIEVMVGCMDECALGIAAGLHFALGRPNVVYADLDGHLDLLQDPTSSAVKLKSGVLYPSPRPGLGFSF